MTHWARIAGACRDDRRLRGRGRGPGDVRKGGGGAGVRGAGRGRRGDRDAGGGRSGRCPLSRARNAGRLAARPVSSNRPDGRVVDGWMAVGDLWLPDGLALAYWTDRQREAASALLVEASNTNDVAMASFFRLQAAYAQQKSRRRRCRGDHARQGRPQRRPVCSARVLSRPQESGRSARTWLVSSRPMKPCFAHFRISLDQEACRNDPAAPRRDICEGDASIAKRLEAVRLLMSQRATLDRGSLTRRVPPRIGRPPPSRSRTRGKSRRKSIPARIPRLPDAERRRPSTLRTRPSTRAGIHTGRRCRLETRSSSRDLTNGKATSTGSMRGR